MTPTDRTQGDAGRSPGHAQARPSSQASPEQLAQITKLHKSSKTVRVIARSVDLPVLVVRDIVAGLR